MAYSELIKNFNRIRTYLRSFYVFGFQHRDEYTEMSARSYDNERRRIESWLGEYMSFGQDEDGRRVFLSVDSRCVAENPLYRAFRTKSFTDRDITLYFHILDLLNVSEALSISEMMDGLTLRLSEFDMEGMPDESTVRKKLKEYMALGIVTAQKRGRESIYRLSEDSLKLSTWKEALAFYSEVSPLGVAGSFAKDRILEGFSQFRFKHHYILNALDSEILYVLFSAIGSHQMVTFTFRGRERVTCPLKVYIGTQTGRQYLLGWSLKYEDFSFYRVDLMDQVKAGDGFTLPGDMNERMEEFCSHVWGVASKASPILEHVEMTVLVGEREGFIVERLMREKRCGTVEQLDESHWRFTADLRDALEIVPWLRTFTGKVTDLQCSNPIVLRRFWRDFDEMSRMYDSSPIDVKIVESLLS